MFGEVGGAPPGRHKGCLADNIRSWHPAEVGGAVLSAAGLAAAVAADRSAVPPAVGRSAVPPAVAGVARSATADHTAVGAAVAAARSATVDPMAADIGIVAADLDQRRLWCIGDIPAPCTTAVADASAA